MRQRPTGPSPWMPRLPRARMPAPLLEPTTLPGIGPRGRPRPTTLATLLNERRDAGGVARPRVLLNCACSLDGKIAAPDGQAMPLSDEADWRRVHLLRASSDAILVGVGTIVKDDPSLKVKEDLAPVPPNRKLLRVVLDAKGRTPPGARVVDGSAPTLILTGPGVRSR